MTAAEHLAEEAADAISGLADLLPQLVRDVVFSTVRDTHTAVAARAFGAVPGAAPIQAIHDGIAGAVYRAIGWSAGRAERGMRSVAKASAGVRDPGLLEGNRSWRTTVAILNGVLGDLMAEQRNPLAITMSVRREGADVPLDRRELQAAFPAARGRVAVLLHGLVESDDSWQQRAEERGGTTYLTLLEDQGWTPVPLRYNTGRHISDSAQDLAELLEQLVERWPGGIEELLLIGHSMGGLVIRGAADLGVRIGLHWPELVGHVVLLGSPHSGAPLETVANAGAWLLSAVPEMAPFGSILRRRSAGIKDLRHGYIRREDWEDRDPDALRSARASAAEPLPSAVSHNVAATLTADRRHPVGHVLGDLLVRWDSARAGGHEWARTATITHVGPATHFELLNHPQVATLLADLTTS